MRIFRSLSIMFLLLVAGAAGATDINVSDVQGAANDPGSFTIDLANVSGASIVSARVNYPASEVVSLSASNGNCDTSTPGQINFLAMPPANGTVCTVTFTFAPNATPGDYPLFVNQESCPGDPNCNANGGFLTVLGPDFTSDPIPGGSPIFLNGTVGGPAATAEISTSNTGTTDLTVLPSPSNPPFSVSPSTLQTLFPSGGDERTIFTLSCDSADGGSFFETFSFQTNDPDEANPSYSVFCTIDGPEVDIIPQSGTLLDINVPTTGATGSYQLLIANQGTQPLTITPSNLPPPFTTDGPITIPPGGTAGPHRGLQGFVPWNVSCNSATPGQFATTLTLTTNDANEPTFTYPVTCNVGPQDIDPTPAAGTPYNLSTPPGVATTANLNLANRGAEFLYPTFSGLSGPLSIAPSGKISVGPGADRDFTITCDSPTTGTFSQVLTVDSNDPDEPSITFPVNCNVGGPEFDPTPAAGTTIALATNIGTTTSGTITVSNPGSGTLDVAASALSGTLSVAPPQQSIAQGGSATFTIGCAPTAASTDAQTLTLTTNDTDEPTATYPVECTGIDPGPRSLTPAAGSGQVAVPNAQGNPLVVQAREGNSPLFGETVTWTLVSGSDVNIAQPVTQTNAQGRAQTDISFGPNPTNATIEARDSQDNVATFSIAAPPTQGSSVFLQITTGDNQTGAVGTNSDQPILFETRDGNLQGVPNVQLTLVVSSGSATLPVTVASTDANGQYALSFRYGDVPGPIRIKATVAGTIEAVEARATAFAPTLTPASGNNQTGAPGTRLAQPLVVSIAQPAGAELAKGLQGATVTWTVVAGGGSVAPSSNQTDANGRASAQLTLGPAAGLNQVRATIAGAGSVTFNATATGAGTLVFEQVSGNNQVLSGNATSEPLVVRLRDGNTTIGGARVRWVVPEDAQPSATQTTTGSDGESSITAVLLGENAVTIFAELPDFPSVASIPFVLSRGIASGAQEGTPAEEVGAALDNGCPALEQAASSGQSLTPAQQDLLARCRELAAGTDGTSQTENALEELAADEVEAQNTAVVTVQAAQFNNLKARIAALRSGQNNSFGGLALNTTTGALPLSFLPSMILTQDGESDAGGGAGEAGAEFSRWGFFASGTIGSGDRNRTENNAGFDYSNYGLTAGVDYRVNDSLILGAAVGWSNNDTDVSDNGGGLDTSGRSLSGYATYYKGDSFYLDGVFTFGRNDFDITRRIEYTIGAIDGGITRVDQLAKADTSGDQTSIALSFGKDFARGAWLLGPYVRGTYTKVEFDGYTEEVSDPSAPGAGFALEFDDRRLVSKELVLGGKVTYTASTSWGILMPHLSVEYLRELEDDPDALVSRFVADPTGTPIVVDADAVDQSYFNLGLGLSAVFANGKSAFIYYEHRAGQSEMSMDNLAIGVRIEF